MTPKTLNEQEALLNFSEIAEEAYVLVKAPRYLKVHFLKKALIRMIYNTYHMFKSLSHLAQVILPGIIKDFSYSAQYLQTHLDDVLIECEGAIVIVENKDGKSIGVLIPLQLYKMMFQ